MENISIKYKLQIQLSFNYL